MEYLTAEQIDKRADRFENDLSYRREVNRLFRAQDESRLYPVRGRFSVTERAIRRARRFERESGVPFYGLEYCYFLENEISRIVNDPRL
ncbi:MAG: hypothetical protein ABIJ57_00100 [Pseudomonadota bacterium]